MTADSPLRNIIIIGGGIIGCTSAYFITRHPSYNPAIHSVTILEATGIASGASGKAGGLLALWAYPSNIVPLSYRLHAELATEHNGAQRWGYRKIHCGSLSATGEAIPAANNGDVKKSKEEEWAKLPKQDAAATARFRSAGVPQDLDWFIPSTITAYSEMGDPTTTAQVHPYQFTTSMAELAQERGAKIILGAVKSLGRTGNRVTSVTYEDKASKETHTLQGTTDVILSAGPWTSHILPEAPIAAVRAHSVTIKASVSPYAIFSEISLPATSSSSSSKPHHSQRRQHTRTVSPEMYARPNGEVYACGDADSLVPLPASSDLVEYDTLRCDDIVAAVGSISRELRDGEVRVRQACYLPSVVVAGDRGGSSNGGPLIGPTRTDGLYLAAGHTCWGIQNSCATGKIVSEFLFEGRAVSADVGSLDPRNVF